ncbi:hypothetical protein, conserved [Eimeria maxima]|uniref:Uncharacterized protein n=1 Tax=Eimeria maxima TaxID=5804 RepID=U6MGE8_EIMMA|nr:hypothetical protein, conserved [Eimeria maxima]CDJ60725.1 hypothetical protein, conserved [Eimeria maxima]
MQERLNAVSTTIDARRGRHPITRVRGTTNGAAAASIQAANVAPRAASPAAGRTVAATTPATSAAAAAALAARTALRAAETPPPAAGTAAAASPNAATPPPAATAAAAAADAIIANKDVQAASLLLHRWEQQRDQLLVTSWDAWAAAVGVSVQQLQQIVLLAHVREPSSQQHKERKKRQSAAADAGASPPAAVADGESQSSSGSSSRSSSKYDTITCPSGVLSADAYELLLQLLRAEGALLQKGPQGADLLRLQRPPTVGEWAAAAAADAQAAEAAAVAEAVTSGSADADLGNVPAAAAATEVITAATPSGNELVHARPDLSAAEVQQREVLHKQLSALHSLVSWQQRQLAAAAGPVVRRFHNTSSARQEMRVAAVDGAAAATAATASTAATEGDALLLVAMKSARECLKKYATDAMHSRYLAASAPPAADPAALTVAAEPSAAIDQDETSNSSNDSSNGESSSSGSKRGRKKSSSDSSSNSSSIVAPHWGLYWQWMQQGMVQWNRQQRVSFELPASWFTAAAAARAVQHQQEQEELQQQQEGVITAPGMDREKPTKVGDLLESDETQRDEEQQQQHIAAAADEVWRFAADHLTPEQLQALKHAAENTDSLNAHEQLQRNTLLQQAVQRLREAELKRVQQHQPGEESAATEVDPEQKQQMLLEHSPLLHLVRQAYCS